MLLDDLLSYDFKTWSADSFSNAKITWHFPQIKFKLIVSGLRDACSISSFWLNLIVYVKFSGKSLLLRTKLRKHVNIRIETTDMNLKLTTNTIEYWRVDYQLIQALCQFVHFLMRKQSHLVQPLRRHLLYNYGVFYRIPNENCQFSMKLGDQTFDVREKKWIHVSKSIYLPFDCHWMNWCCFIVLQIFCHVWHLFLLLLPFTLE